MACACRDTHSRLTSHGLHSPTSGKLEIPLVSSLASPSQSAFRVPEGIVTTTHQPRDPDTQINPRQDLEINVAIVDDVEVRGNCWGPTVTGKNSFTHECSGTQTHVGICTVVIHYLPLRDGTTPPPLSWAFVCGEGGGIRRQGDWIYIKKGKPFPL